MRLKYIHPHEDSCVVLRQSYIIMRGVPMYMYVYVCSVYKCTCCNYARHYRIILCFLKAGSVYNIA